MSKDLISLTVVVFNNDGAALVKSGEFPKRVVSSNTNLAKSAQELLIEETGIFLLESEYHLLEEDNSFPPCSRIVVAECENEFVIGDRYSWDKNLDDNLAIADLGRSRIKQIAEEKRSQSFRV